MRPFPHRFIKNLRGVVAIEFALIVPVMLIILTGIIELSNYMMAARRVTGAAYAAADLISQETDLNIAGFIEILEVTQLIMAPFDTTKLSFGVASVRYDDDTGEADLKWEARINGGTVDEAESLASGLGDAGESVIIVSTKFAYTPLFNIVFSGSYTLSDTAITRPRYIDYIGVF
ncbi:MAG: TadE/TadG family type IV pilus assembly protein [Alphaproteobacteria bacterium]